MKMNEYRIRDERGYFNVHSGAMFKLLGLTGSYLPAEGMPVREIQGIRVWVISKDDAKAAGYFHRVRAECPRCKKYMSAGRLHQHRCTI